METDDSSVVLDTPERMVAGNDGNVSFEDVSTSPSSGRLRRDGLTRWRGNHRSDRRGSFAISLGSHSSSRSGKWGPLPLMSREVRVYPLKREGVIEHKRDLRDDVITHSQTGVGGKNEEEMRGKVIDTRSRMVAGSSCSNSYINGITDLGKDVNRDSGLDSSIEVINLESPLQFKPIRRMLKDTSLKVPDYGRRVNSSSDSHSERVQKEPRTSKLEDLSKTCVQKMSSTDALVSPCIKPKGINSVSQSGEGALSNDSKRMDKGKAIELSPDSLPNNKGLAPNSFDVESRSRITRQRRLVRNGCISPANIARSKIILDVAKDEANNNILAESLQINSSRQAGSSSIKVEGHCPGKAKGKNILDAHFPNGVELKTRSSRSRAATTTMRPRNDTVVGDADMDISFFAQGPDWKTTGNRRRSSKGVAITVDEAGCSPSWVYDDNANVGEPLHVDEIAPHDFVPPPSHGSTSNPVDIFSSVSRETVNTRCQGSQRLMEGKRKNRSGQRFLGETSVIGTSEPILPVIGQPSNTISTGSTNGQGCNVVVHSIIGIDELSSPELRHKSGNSSISDVITERDLQVESDELLARQLQEQFFNESLGSGNLEESDASIAWRLQQEVDTRRRPSTLRRQSQPRVPRYPSRNPSGQLASRQPRVTPGVSQLRRNLNRQRMDLESRLNYLEALEAAFESSNSVDLPTGFYHLARDFNENDYEMLLALDNENHNHAGAQHHQINCLPLSVVQTENLEEVCAVCLDAPSVGDSIRHLPCLHKFHKECIDTWLRRKPSCPVCKSEIS